MTPIVISMSALQTFLRCGKKYEIQYEMLLDGVKENEAMAEGTAFHSIMAHYATYGQLPDEDSPMRDVASAWLRENEFPKNVVLVEEPIYVQFLDGVYVRCTFDLVYRDMESLVVRDWKTFARLPSLDADLDFQARLYIVCAMKHFKTSKVRFEHVYVRRTPPYIPHNKKGDVWDPQECYQTMPLVISLYEATKIADETTWELQRLLETSKSKRFTRTNLKGGGYDACPSCSVKEICKVNLLQDDLTEDMLRGISTKREPIEIPEGLT